ncbi:glycosyltransferase WbuB [Halobacillus andaensis]|uniref:Glycosyltransferase WbuB n=1 Tax=Halobacillus andaensis TaxID=1176239 RepID=A0A917B575_HALAA|nr:glycosyltransferase family 4 protein [Halobacillus andaensis]MBP2004304.1 glycosyltransferase involved in cell wall biosynthesis [Halobacillus andaensis]GGF22676.1 glycosyltransferase WbuB [Halobacillus andaensis]
MRILYIHQYFKTRGDAGGTRSYEFGRHLVNKGHEVTVLTTDINYDYPVEKFSKNAKVYNIDGMKVIAVKGKYSNYMSYPKRILSFLSFMINSTFISLKESKKYDVIFATSTPLTVAVPALITKKINKTPYIFEVRDLWPEVPIKVGAIKNKIIIKLLKILETTTYKNAEHIVALSPGMQDGVINTGISKNKTTLVPNCSDIDLFGKKNAKAVPMLSTLKKKYNLIVTHGGSMGVANGLDYIIKTAKYLKEKGVEDICFVLTGDGKTKPKLESMVNKHRLDNVIFLGKISKENMPNVLEGSDITLTIFKNLPILATNSPNKFFDSLAAARPTIVNSNGWTKDIVEDNQIGFYVNPEKPSELGELLIDLKKEKEMLKEMGRRARQLAEKQYDRKKLAEKVEKILLNYK